MGGQSVDWQAARDTYALTREVERLRAENDRLGRTLREVKTDAAMKIAEVRADQEQMRGDLGYLLRLAEGYTFRSNRLRALLKRYADLALGVRPGLRKDRSLHRSLQAPEPVSVWERRLRDGS